MYTSKDVYERWRERLECCTHSVSVVDGERLECCTHSVSVVDGERLEVCTHSVSVVDGERLEVCTHSMSVLSVPPEVSPDAAFSDTKSVQGFV